MNQNTKMAKRGGKKGKQARAERRREDFEKERDEKKTSNVEEDTQSYTSRIGTQPNPRRVGTQQSYTSRIATQQPYTSRIGTPSPTGRYFPLNHPQSAEEGTQPNTRRVGTPSYTYEYYPADHHQYPQERNNNRICYCNDCVQERRQVSYGKNTAGRCYCYDCGQRDNSFISNGFLFS